MHIAIGSDQRTHLTDTVLEELERRGIEVGRYWTPGSPPLTARERTPVAWLASPPLRRVTPFPGQGASKTPNLDRCVWFDRSDFVEMPTLSSMHEALGTPGIVGAHHEREEG